MKKQIVKKIISTTIVFLFAIFFLQILSPIVVSAANELNWENPNKNGRNPYKFRPQDALNSQLIMQVVGCTGVVDKVSGAITGLVQKKKQAIIRKMKREAVIQVCQKGKAAAETSVSWLEQQYVNAIKDSIDCNEYMNVLQSPEYMDQMIATDEKTASTKKREECFNGIAITLARNQLTAMTRYTVNWVNSGFNGDPMYVRNITSLTNSMERNVLETGIDILANDARKKFPYGKDFSRSLVTSYRSGAIKYGATNFLDSLASDLGSFVTDPRSYYSEENLQETPFERSTRINYAFSNDFATGGWDGWLALTQRDQNNPLGFTMLASQYLADQEQQKIEETKQELLVNNGILSQKRCVEYQVYEDVTDVDGNIIPGKRKAKTKRGIDSLPSNWETLDPNDPIFTKYDTHEYVYSPTRLSNSLDSDCTKQDVVTPGSLIKDKVSTYLNSPERQLEVADTINESLNALFTALIARFQNQGLSSLSSEDYTFSDPNMGTGYGSNSLDSIDMFGESTSGGYTNGSFDLTRDLGNKYIHNYTSGGLGDWDASINKVWDANKKLNIGIGPRGFAGDPLTNVYYTVKVPGTTKLFEDGYNGWGVGDRAFWNGSEWQNWKKGTANPIKERGVIQIQKDYIVAANELLKKLPNIMPKIGELDYCIPGPNPSWETNSGDTKIAFTDYEYSLSSTTRAGSFLKRDSTSYSIAGPGDKEYDNYKDMFSGTSRSWWQSILNSSPISELILLSEMGLARGGGDMINNENRINNHFTKINYDFENFNKIFKENMSYLYGDRMLKPFKEKENTSELIPNPEYLPMAEEGLNITKNILSYDEDLKGAIADYTDSVIQANSNIYKLDQIRSKVSEIIIAAQGRRDARLLEILKKETAEKCKQERALCLARTDLPIDDIQEICGGLFGQCNQNIMTEAEYKTKYASCLEEEDILYMEDLEITNYDNEEGRCSDGLDNDKDGDVDFKDSDCNQGGGIAQGDAYCGNASYVTEPHIPHGITTTSCITQDTILKNNNVPEATRKTTCESYSYYMQNNGIDESPDPYLTYDCKWILETN